MKETLLHYIWQNKLYDDLRIGDERVTVLKSGTRNPNDGPDFRLARVAWCGIEWCGAVEIHRKSSDWERHGHHTDPGYDGVVLHVVYEEDRQVSNTRGERVPTAVMTVADEVMERLRLIDTTNAALRCAPEISVVPGITLRNIIDRMAVERLEVKMAALKGRSEEGTPQVLFYRTLMRYLGAHTNNDAMEQVALSLPYSFLKKHANDVVALEAMLLGQANLLAEPPRDEYERILSDEYRFYASKFGLSAVAPGIFRKLRVRPHSYAPRMLAIAAVLMGNEGEIMQAISQLDRDALFSLLASPPSQYWTEHYDFAHRSSRRLGHLGSSSLHSLLINAVVPTAYLYHTSIGNGEGALTSLAWLTDLPAEKNRIVTLFEKQGITPRNAHDSQALLHIYNHYCMRGACLACPIAPEIFKALKDK